MNRLAKTRCYLSGSIENTPDAGIGWRQKLKEDLFYMDIVWLDPTQKPGINIGEEVGKARELCELAKFNELEQFVKKIRKYDLQSVKVSDFLIVHIDLERPTCGTYEEIFKARDLEKPVLSVTKQGMQKNPLWLFGVISPYRMFDTWHGLQALLKRIAYDETYHPGGDWEFLNFKSTLDSIK